MLMKIGVGTRFTFGNESYIVTGTNRYNVTHYDISNHVELELKDSNGVVHILQFGESTYSVGNSSLIGLTTLLRNP
jgi:hypothetical protein